MQRGLLDRDPADVHGLEHRVRVQVAELPGFQPICLSFVTAVVGGNFHAIAHRGSRPTTPSRRWSSTSLTFTTAPSISNSSCAAPRLPRAALLDDLVLGPELLDVGMDREAVLAQPLQRIPVRGERDPLGGADRICPERQRPVGGQLRIELTDRARRGVARVHERRQPRLGPALVELCEVRQRHVHLAADFDHRRRIGPVQLERDRRHRPQVVRDVLPDLPVAARGAPLEHAVAIDQRDRQAVDLRLHHVLELGILDPLPRQVVAHPRDPGAQLIRRARVRQRQHLLWVAHLFQIAHRLAADALRRRVRRHELGMLGLDRPQLVDQNVVLVVADLRVVEDVVAVAVVVELPAQLGGTLRRSRVRPGLRRVSSDCAALTRPPRSPRLLPAPRLPPARSAVRGRGAAARRDPHGR